MIVFKLFFIIEFTLIIKKYIYVYILKFDITKFYPSITKATFINSLKLAKKFTPITENKQKLILHF